MSEKNSEPTVHILVPKMEVASATDVEALCSKHGISIENLPRIRVTDHALIPIGSKVGDIIKVFRQSPTTGDESLYYRLVVE